MYGSTYSNAELLSMMDERVYGHTSAKKVLINAINRSKIRWHQEFSLGMNENELLDNKNVLLIGASGNGKTLLVETVCDLCDVPFMRFDSTQIKPAGSGEGLTIKKMISDIQQHCAWVAHLSNGQYTASEIMKQTIVFIDEVDKLCISYESSGNWNKMVQANLLQLVDGKTDIQGVTFIFAGAFAEMLARDISPKNKSIGFHKQDNPTEEQEKDWDEAIVKEGVVPELAGRIHSVVKLDSLDESDYNNILDKHIIPKFIRQLEYYDCFDFSLSDDVRNTLITKAIKSQQGVRMLTKEVQKLAEEYEFAFEERRELLLLDFTREITGE